MPENVPYTLDWTNLDGNAFPEDGDTVFLLPVCTTTNRLVKMIAALDYWRVTNRDGDFDHMIDVLQAMAYVDKDIDCPDGLQPIEQPEQALYKVKSALGMNCDCCDHEEMDDMACAKPIKIGDKWYLYSDCAGCDNPLYFELTQVAIDGDGQPISELDGGGIVGSFPNSDLIVSDGNVNCYGIAATSYLMNRAIEFGNAVIDWVTLGTDFAAGNADEILQVPLLVSRLIAGDPDLLAIQQFTKEQVSTALNDSTFQTTLATNWTFTGSPKRNELRQWVRSAPYFVGAVPVRLVLEAWLDYSLVFGYSGDLLAMASECETGGTIPTPPPFPLEWGVLYDFTDEQFDFIPAGAGVTGNALYVAGEGWTTTTTVSQQGNITFSWDKPSLYNVTGFRLTTDIAPTANPRTYIHNGEGTEIGRADPLALVSDMQAAITGDFDELRLGIQYSINEVIASEDIFITSLTIYGTGLVPDDGVQIV